MSYRDEYRQANAEVWWTAPRAFTAIFMILVCVYALGFIATGGDLLIYKFWAPKQENAKRQVFENTQSYVQGKIEYLTKLRYQYQEADGQHKDSLRLMILTEASTVDNNKLPPDLSGFIASIGGSYR
jgi:hypothetical protein